jgi:hypothetical protein
MKRIRSIGLTFIAALALASLFAASAQATKHVNNGPLKFTATSSAPSFEPEGAGEVTCTSGTAAGEITTAVSGHMTAVLTGCATEGQQCHSAGQPEGTIATEELATELGYINRTNGEVGTEFKPASGEFFAKFDCPGTPDIYIALKEAVIGRLEPVNVVATSGALNLKGALARQEVEKFQGGAKHTLLFEVSTEGQAGFEKGEFISFGGVQTVDWMTSNSEQEEAARGNKIKRFPDAAKVITTGTQPEYARCRKAKQGKWRDAACTVKAVEKNGKFKGRYELFPVPS